jgi:signal transduction histidine kinase
MMRIGSGGSNSERRHHGFRLEALANLAHELRTPIQVLLGYVDILREDLAGEVGPRARQVVERLNVNAHDLAQTVENMLEFAIAYADAEVEDDEEIVLGELIAEIKPVLEALNLERGLTMNFDLDGAPARVRSRHKPLRSILANLAANAIKFTERGTVTIAIHALPSAAQCREIEIEVSDTGPGIDPERLREAFTPGKQLSGSSTRRYRGMGLGLAVVRRNLDALGATLEVDTRPECGTRFTVRIPMYPRIVVNGARKR